MLATYTKLRNGSWGVRVQGSVREGSTLSVTTKAGQTKTETVEKVIWSGNGVSICAIGTRQSDSRGSSRRPGKWTGCSCGSREDSYGDLIPSARNCASCEHDA